MKLTHDITPDAFDYGSLGAVLAEFDEELQPSVRLVVHHKDKGKTPSNSGEQ